MKRSAQEEVPREPLEKRVVENEHQLKAAVVERVPFEVGKCLTEIKFSIVLQNVKKKDWAKHIGFLARGLKDTTQLTSLDFNGNRFASVLLESCKNNTNLNYLKCSNSSPESLYSQLCNFTNLKTLQLDNCDLYLPSLFNSLTLHTHLTDLNISTCSSQINENWPPVWIDSFCSFMKSHSLRTLNMSYSFLTIEDSSPLIEAFKNCTSLTHLNLRNNTISSTKFISDYLVNNNHLTYLNMGCVFSHRGDEMKTLLGKMVKDNQTLKYLILSKNNFYQELALISEALQHNTTLTYLDLSWNEDEIEDGRYESFFKNLQFNQTLTFLNLSGNKITTGAALESFANYLNSNSSLTSLNLPDVETNSSNIKVFFKALFTHPKLQNLYIPYELKYYMSPSIKYLTKNRNLTLLGMSRSYPSDSSSESEYSTTSESDCDIQTIHHTFASKMVKLNKIFSNTDELIMRWPQSQLNLPMDVQVFVCEILLVLKYFGIPRELVIKTAVVVLDYDNYHTLVESKRCILENHPLKEYFFGNCSEEEQGEENFDDY